MLKLPKPKARMDKMKHREARMNHCRYLMIGGGLAAHNAAKAIRQADPKGTITIVGNESYRPYNRPPLTKGFMRGQEPPEKVFLESPDFYMQQHIDLRLGQHVERLDAAGKTVRLAGGEELSFDKALLAMGGRPVKLDIPGIDFKGVHYFRTLNDAISVSQSARPDRHIAIIGGGFIGLELAGSLSQRGMKVAVIDNGPHIWSRFIDRTLAAFMMQYCQERGINIFSGERVAKILGLERPTGIVMQSGRTIACGLVIVAAGIVPNVELAKSAGLEVDNGVMVDEHLCTSNPDIYAAGDLCNYPDPYFLRRRRVEHWGQADYTGTLAGQNMAGGSERYDLLTYVWSDILDLHLEFAGDEYGYDQTILRGSPQKGGFSLLYMKGQILTAHFSVNLPREQFAPLEKLITHKVSLAGREEYLSKTQFDLNTLLPQEVRT